MLTWLILIYLPLWSIVPNTYFKCGDIAGYYSIAIQIAYICDIWDKEFTKNHEIGHHIWFNLLTDEAKERYEALYNQAKKQWNKAFLRDYSQTSVIEDFADVWSLYIMNQKTNIFIKKRITFIKNLKYDIQIRK